MELVAAVDEAVLDGVPHQMDAGPHHKHYHQQVLLARGRRRDAEILGFGAEG